MKQVRGSYRWMWLAFAVVALVGLPLLVTRALIGAGVIDTLNVMLDTPVDGAVVYNSTLTVSGQTEGVGNVVMVYVEPSQPTPTFTGYSYAADVINGRFSVDFIPAYDGSPLQMVVSVYRVNDIAREMLKAKSVFILATAAERPDGVYVDVLAPQPGDEAGGDLIGVSGRASGVVGGALTVELSDSNAQIIDTRTITLQTTNLLDDVPWLANLKPRDAKGNAIIRIKGADGTLYQTIPVILSSAAG